MERNMTLKTIDPKAAKELLDQNQAILVDVREPAEHSSEKIEGAHLSPVGSICISDLPTTDKKILIHCQKGARGNTACQKLLAENDNIEIYNIEGGIEAWRQSGLPTLKGDKKVLPLDRQVQLTVGLGVLIFGLLGYFAHPVFALGAAFFGAGLTNAGLTGWCGLAKLIAKMPWNQG